MSKRVNQGFVLLAAGVFITFGAAVQARTMHQQEGNPDVKQDQADANRQRAIRTEDDRKLNELRVQIHKASADLLVVRQQLIKDKKALKDAEAKYAADQKSHASADQLEKDRRAIEQAKTAMEKTLQTRQEDDQKIAQWRSQIKTEEAKRNKDTVALKAEQEELYQDEANAKGKGKDKGEEGKDRSTRTEDDRRLKELGDQIHKAQADRAAVNMQLIRDKQARNEAEGKYAADQKSHASAAQLEKDRQAVEQARTAEQKELQTREEYDRKIAQLQSQYAALNAKRNKDAADRRE